MLQRLSTELASLALKSFDADAALSAALAEFQAEPPADSIIAAAQRAAAFGLSWFTRPSEFGLVEVRLRHRGGAEIGAEGESIPDLLVGLLGHPLAQNLAAFAAPSPTQAAAESLAAATGGAVVTEPSETEPSEYVPDPDEDEQARLAGPLTDEQKAVCVGMIRALTTDQRRAFTIAFRDAFKVPREAKAIAPLITEGRHMEFCDRWTIEAGGGVAA